MSRNMPMRTVVVDLGCMAISAAADEILVAHSLGSCLGVTFYDPILRIGGMAHCVLPLSQINCDKAHGKPGLFVDVGIPLLLDEMFKRGCHKKDLVTHAAGAARVMDSANLFRIGERNHAVFRKIMWKNGMFIRSEEVGGEQTRTLRLEIATGRVIVQSQGRDREL